MPKKSKEAKNQFLWAAQFMHDGKWITLYGAPYERIKLRLLPIAKK